MIDVHEKGTFCPVPDRMRHLQVGSGIERSGEIHNSSQKYRLFLVAIALRESKISVTHAIRVRLIQQPVRNSVV